MITLEQLHTILMRLDYPASRDDLLAQLAHREMPREVLERIAALPEHMYGSVDTVMDTLRGDA